MEFSRLFGFCDFSDKNITLYSRRHFNIPIHYKAAIIESITLTKQQKSSIKMFLFVGDVSSKLIS